MGGVRGLIAQSDGPGFFDDEVLNEFTIPFGESSGENREGGHSRPGGFGIQLNFGE